MPAKRGGVRHLLELCFGYFFFYVLTGVFVKYFTVVREPRISEMAYLINNTLGGSLFALSVIFLLGWHKIKTSGYIEMGLLKVPEEVPYIITSGICTAIVIPTTTLLYMLPISVMVAMVIMRGSVIVVSRLIDEIQIYQGILKKRITHSENYAAAFALAAVGINIFHDGSDKFALFNDRTAMIVLGLYVTAYFIRLYIMNYYKNTRYHAADADNHGFFAIEQIAASATLFLAVTVFYFSDAWFGWSDSRLSELREAVERPELTPLLTGVAFGAVAFFSVFIFLFEGKNATFTGLVNRLTSLIAGIVGTVIMALVFSLHFP